MEYKEKVTFDERKKESERISVKYPTRIPIICHRSSSCKDAPVMGKKKFLVPRDMTMANFMFIIRQKMKLEQEKSIFLFVNDNSMVPTSQLISQVYQDHGDKDGFLYIKYGMESTFG